ncbi:MAG: DUF1343 domain-containing protein [Bacteroidota bacterium]
MKTILISFIIIFYLLSSNVISQKAFISLGADRLVSDEFYLIAEKNVSIVTNHSAILSNGIHLVDTLYNLDNVQIKALFAPEHGIRGDAPDGHSIKDGVDTKTNIPIYSLYGKNRKPTKEMLKDVDIIIFDIQDIGARYYTYISTLYYSLIAAAENQIPIIVLDRPNPINGITVDGPIREEKYKSFVAIAPIPIQHGMTIGELATLFNSEGWLGENHLKADLTVVEMTGWDRELFFDVFNLTWINPSPNIPSLNTALLYPGMCLLEGVNVSEGRGTHSPFLTFGAPYINSDELLNELNNFNHNGIELSTITFTPTSIENMSTNPKYKNVICNGISIKVIDKKKINALRFGITTLAAIHKLYPDDFKYRKNWLNKLFGNEYLSEMINNNDSPTKIFQKWESDIKQFKFLREKYLLY